MTDKSTPDADSLRLELQEALETFRNWIGQLVQAGGIMATADAVLVTYGFSQRLAGIFLVGSTFPIAVLLGYIRLTSKTAPMLGLAIRLERELFLEESLALTIAPKSLRIAASKLTNPTDISQELSIMNAGFFRQYRPDGAISAILYASSVIQIVLAILSLTVYGYKFM